MIVVHHLNESRSLRILWLLEELEVPYEIKRYQRNSETMLAPEELRKVHALGKSPVIVDQGRVYAETGAIIEYLVRTYGAALLPKVGTEAYDRYIYWLHFGEGSAMPILLLKLVFDTIEEKPLPFFVRTVAKQISKQVGAAFINPNLVRTADFIEEHLSRHVFFAGDAITGADFLMSYPLDFAVGRGVVTDKHPATTAYLAKIQGRPGYQAAVAKA